VNDFWDVHPKASMNTPSSFVKAYHADVEIISKENFREFIGLADGGIGRD